MSACLSLNSVADTIDYVGPDEGPDGPGGMTGWAGTDVWYAGVSETNEEGPGGTAAGLFGEPASVSGNTIDFDPTFRADAEGPEAEIVDGQLNFMVVALGNNVIDNLQFSEAGDTTLAGINFGGNSISSVTAKFFIDVIAVDGVSLGVPLNIQAEMDFIPVGATAPPPGSTAGGQWSLNDDGNGFTFATSFSGSLFVDINQALTDAGIDFIGGATKLNVAVDNTLTAIAQTAGYEAFIAKKDFDGLTVTSNVPEPTAVMLVLLGMTGTVLRRR